MPIIKSAKKRVRVAKKAAIRNSKTKRNLKTALKAFIAKPSGNSQAKAQSKIDTAMKKGYIHANKAARLKKRLAAQAKAAKVKPATAKTPVKKTAGKSTAGKPRVKKAKS